MTSNSPDRQTTGLTHTPDADNVLPLHRNKQLVPVGDEYCGQRIAAWLKSNPHLHEGQLMLVHVAEPEWLSDVPYSGAQAWQTIQNHHLRVAAKEEMLGAMALMLRLMFPGLMVESKVITDSDRARAITELAVKWNADSITIFSRPKRRFSRFFGNNLTRSILARADHTVQVIQETERTNEPAFSIVECGAH